MPIDYAISRAINQATGLAGKTPAIKKKILENLSIFLRTTPPTKPFNHKPWLYLAVNTALFASLGLLLGLGYLYPTLQDTFLPTNDLRFTNNGQYFLVMAWLFILPFLISAISYGKLWFVPSWRDSFFTSLLGEQLLYIGEKMTPEEIYKTYDPEKYGRSMIKRYILITTAVFLITLPLQYQALQSATSLNNEGVTITSTFRLAKQSYSWSDVTKAERSFEIDESIIPQLIITFSDGKTINLWDTGFSGTKTTDLLSAIDLLREHDIFITTQNIPSLKSLRKGREIQVQTVFNY